MDEAGKLKFGSWEKVKIGGQSPCARYVQLSLLGSWLSGSCSCYFCKPDQWSLLHAHIYSCLWSVPATVSFVGQLNEVCFCGPCITIGTVKPLRSLIMWSTYMEGPAALRMVLLCIIMTFLLLIVSCVFVELLLPTILHFVP